MKNISLNQRGLQRISITVAEATIWHQIDEIGGSCMDNQEPVE